MVYVSLVAARNSDRNSGLSIVDWEQPTYMRSASYDPDTNPLADY